MARPFFRSSTNSKIAGVCGGLAEYLDMDANLVRLLTVAVVVLTGVVLGVVLYIAAAFIFPQR